MDFGQGQFKTYKDMKAYNMLNNSTKSEMDGTCRKNGRSKTH